MNYSAPLVSINVALVRAGQEGLGPRLPLYEYATLEELQAAAAEAGHDVGTTRIVPDEMRGAARAWRKGLIG